MRCTRFFAADRIDVNGLYRKENKNNTVSSDGIEFDIGTASQRQPDIAN